MAPALHQTDGREGPPQRDQAIQESGGGGRLGAVEARALVVYAPQPQGKEKKAQPHALMVNVHIKQNRKKTVKAVRTKRKNQQRGRKHLGDTSLGPWATTIQLNEWRGEGNISWGIHSFKK